MHHIKLFRLRQTRPKLRADQKNVMKSLLTTFRTFILWLIIVLDLNGKEIRNSFNQRLHQLVADAFYENGS